MIMNINELNKALKDDEFFLEKTDGLIHREINRNSLDELLDSEEGRQLLCSLGPEKICDYFGLIYIF